ncbi:RPN9 (YDR427W) [Zygosaccharomyces parabailii]|uniref:ZYBA0S05-03642g1_1 n=1 Tax=Zygosaccharomyces bailii (strain CLIB 213 / ATCC 58445 / CBS 680 / BCRC 21525 / NBRC 1098 / NCYC 1416 / NRRL Y-2227) TaxID=1333698 RepID=A0A8J2X0P2_ZYGB2|nr:RPN9 (YDR427W) [Zygosaccharomyces parabailii]CDF89869.1 ZYBA0S05-03642g1_1 [Zygosaccharomyces bailii CLIB 213]SJM87139.1 probable 26S proteasome regulatory subunit RPN9 [Zygosaccharomyces bailii]
MPSNAEVSSTLNKLREEADPDLAPLFYEFEQLYQEKLWHQLTERLKVFFEDPRSSNLRLTTYANFVTTFYDRINQLSVVDFLLQSLKNYDDHDQSLKYLTELEQSFKTIDEKKQRNDGLKNHEDGCLLIEIETARTYLHKGNLVKSRDLLDDLGRTLDSKDSIPLSVTSAFYSTNAEYYRLKKDFNSFYYTSLLYLSTVDQAEIQQQVNLAENRQLAYNLSIAALLGDRIYNFGELLNHPIMDSILTDPTYKWIFDLLNALTVGDFNKFDNLIGVQIPKEPILAEHESFLRQKICLMTLVESVFAKNIRTLSFDDIAQAAHLPKDNVEHLVMRAISLGLLKGSIDQVNELVNITWVQPRIINSAQISRMRDILVDWDAEVTKLGEKIAVHGKSIWV